MPDLYENDYGEDEDFATIDRDNVGNTDDDEEE